MTGDEGVKQAYMTANNYAEASLKHLAEMLDIDLGKPGFQEKLAPFAFVWGSMITAASRDFHTATIAGVVDGTGVQLHVNGHLYVEDHL